MQDSDIKSQIGQELGKEVTRLTLKGKGDCNYAYYLETDDGGRYILKMEREHKETQDQNDLVIEANIIAKLYDTHPTIPIPHIIRVSNSPKFYLYDYIDGELMRSVWPSLLPEEKIDICRSLGHFHAEIGKNLTKEMCKTAGVTVTDIIGLRPSIIEEEYVRLIADADVPASYKNLVKQAKEIFDGTTDGLVFQFIHNDGHPENILIKDKKISGIIDFGDAEYGEVAKEFSRYIRDIPDYFEYIISSYEENSGNKLSRKRIVSNSLISGFPEIVEDYKKGGEGQLKAEKKIELYRKLLDSAV